MKLNLKEIQSITFGADHIEWEDGVCCFYRFTPEQLAFYDGENEWFHEQSYTTAGVRFSFLTDSAYVYMRFGLHRFPLQPGGEWYAKFDVYVNGNMVSHFGFDAATERAETRIALDSGMNHVEVYFPYQCAAALWELSVEDGAVITPQKRGKTMLCFGDSITQGYYAEHPSLTYASQLARFLDADALNKGIGGANFTPELAQLRDTFVPDIISAAYGTNDWRGSSQDEFTRNCRGFFSSLCATYGKTPIYAITPTWRSFTPEEAEVFGAPPSKARKIIKEICGAYPQIQVIDGLPLVAHLPGFFGDGRLHPNDLGFSMYANNLLEKLTNQ